MALGLLQNLPRDRDRGSRKFILRQDRRSARRPLRSYEDQVGLRPAGWLDADIGAADQESLGIGAGCRDESLLVGRYGRVTVPVEF